jgi:hypothetical protein
MVTRRVGIMLAVVVLLFPWRVEVGPRTGEVMQQLRIGVEKTDCGCRYIGTWTVEVRGD